MTILRLSTALLLAITGCFPDHQEFGAPGGGPGGPGNGPPTGGGNPPAGHGRGPQTMSDVHVEPGGERVWLVHSAVADVAAVPAVTTAHLAVYVPATGELSDVLDTTGTLGKRILFPGNGKVLYVTQRGTDRDVFALVDSVARRPLAQRSYPGDRGNFRVSPSGRAVLSIDETDRKLHLLDTASLVDQPVPGTAGPDDVAWLAGQDVLYTLQLEPGTTSLQRYDLRTADLGLPLPAPATVVKLPGNGGGNLVVSLDGRFAAFVMLSGTGDTIQLIELSTGKTTSVPGDFVPAFSNDHRAIVWQRNARNRFDLHLVDPATGAGSPPLASDLQDPVVVPLRHRNALIVGSRLLETPPFLYNLDNGSRATLSILVMFSSVFERPGHAELWMWSELLDALMRLDLATGDMVDDVTSGDSVDYRVDADEVIIGTFTPSVRRVSLATRQDLAPPVVLADPNDVATAFRLEP